MGGKGCDRERERRGGRGKEESGWEGSGKRINSSSTPLFFLPATASLLFFGRRVYGRGSKRHCPKFIGLAAPRERRQGERNCCSISSPLPFRFLSLCKSDSSLSLAPFSQGTIGLQKNFCGVLRRSSVQTRDRLSPSLC